MSTNGEFEFPIDRPEDSPAHLWSLQNALLADAELLLGPRDCSKKIFQPTFEEEGPYLINTPIRDGAFAALSKNAAGYWPTAVYELAHETVHLLNPVAGSTNWLEGGIAVAFSVRISQTMTTHPMAPQCGSNYDLALQLVQRLPGNSFAGALRIRADAGSPSCATEDTLESLFPGLDRTLKRDLLANCEPR